MTRISEADLARIQGAPSRRTSGSPTMNKLETDFSMVLTAWAASGTLLDWQFGSVRLHLGGGSWYKPDFFTWWAGVNETNPGSVVIYETKGFWREAARLRIRVAASLFLQWRFFAVTREDGKWVYEEILP